MTRYVPWTLCGLLSGLVLLGSVAVAQWEPESDGIHKHWFTPPPIFEENLGPWEDQELCYYVFRQEDGTPVPLYYRVAPHYPQRMDPKEWRLPPLVIREERKSVWRSLMEAFNHPRNRWR